MMPFLALFDEFADNVKRWGFKSEWEFFLDAGKRWNFKEDRIKQDFGAYLARDVLPFYVNNLYNQLKADQFQVETAQQEGLKWYVPVTLRWWWMKFDKWLQEWRKKDG